MKKIGLCTVAFLLLAASLCWSQNGPDSVCEVNFAVPKPGGVKAMEEARKKHNEFHKAEKDNRPVSVWEIVTGPRTGSYMMNTCELSWKELDDREPFMARDAVDISKNLGPTLESIQTSYYVWRKDLTPDAALTAFSNGEPKLISVVTYYVKAAELTRFVEAIKRIQAAVKQANYPMKQALWYNLASGGEGPQYVAVVGRNSWAEMQGPDEPLIKVLHKVYGDNDHTLDDFRAGIDHYQSEMSVYRKDLSYIPAK
jgi:hypothetical protein